MVSGQKIAYTANRHTTHFNVDASNKKIQNAVTAITDETESFQKWWDTKVEDEQVIDLFKTTIAKSQANDIKVASGQSDTNKKQLYHLMGLYDAEVAQIHGRGDYGRNGAKGSLWCAYQSATAWSTHLGDVKSNSTNNHIVQQRRQNDVRSLINSKKWKELEVA